MQQYQKYFKPCAIFFCLLYLIFILACPFMIAKVSMYGYSESEGISLSDVMDVSGWPVLAIIASVAMAAAVWFLPGKTAAIACAAGSFLALVSFWLSKTADEIKLSGSFVDYNLGTGPILAIICGIIAAVLCFMSDQGPRRDTTPGVGRGNGNEW